MARVSSLRDGERWEQVGVTIATKGATGAAVGLGLAVLLFGKLRTRAACMSICTGAGVGHGLTLAKSNFEDARAYLPTQLSQGRSDAAFTPTRASSTPQPDRSITRARGSAPTQQRALRTCGTAVW